MLDVNVVVQKLNAYEIPTLLEFITKKDLTPYLIFLNYPLENSLLNLEEEQARIMDFYFNDISTRGSQPELVKILIDFYKKTSPENRLRFSEHFLELRK